MAAVVFATQAEIEAAAKYLTDLTTRYFAAFDLWRKKLAHLPQIPGTQWDHVKIRRKRMAPAVFHYPAPTIGEELLLTWDLISRLYAFEDKTATEVFYSTMMRRIRRNESPPWQQTVLVTWKQMWRPGAEQLIVDPHPWGSLLDISRYNLPMMTVAQALLFSRLVGWRAPS